MYREDYEAELSESKITLIIDLKGYYTEGKRSYFVKANVGLLSYDDFELFNVDSLLDE